MSRRRPARRRRKAAARLRPGPVAAAAGVLLAANLFLAAGPQPLSMAGLMRWDPREWLRDPNLQLRRISFVGLETLEAAQLSDALELPEAIQLIDLDADRACERMARNPRVARCNAVRLPPDSLLVEIEERHPAARLARSDRGISSDGVVLPLRAGEEAGLPRIEGNLQGALQLLRTADRAGVSIDSIDARDRADLVFRPSGADLRVRVGGDLDAALHDWQRMRRTGLIEIYAAREVDLRFRGGAVLRDFEINDRGR
jgi:hypothetical protein